MPIKKYLGQTLTELGFITRQQLEKALLKQKQIMSKSLMQEQIQRITLVSDARRAKDVDVTPLIGQILTEMGFITKKELEYALAEQEKSFAAYMSLGKKRLAIAFEIGSLVNSTLNLAEVLHLIMKYVNRVTNSVASTLMLLDEDTGELVFSIPTGPKEDKLIDVRIPPGKGIAGWVAEHEQSALVADVKEDSRFFPDIDQKIGFETKSVLCVPLISKTKLIGVLEVINKIDGSSFTEEDKLLLSTFGYQAAGAIENARLYGELNDQLEKAKQAKEVLKKSEERYRELVENINDVIYSIDKDIIITYVSPVIKSVMGYDPPEVVGKPVAEFVHPEDIPLMMEKLPQVLSGKLESNEYRLRTKSGEFRWARSSSRPIYEGDHVIGLRGAFVDITAQKQLESQLRQAHKIEAIGTLTGGIAHDFNNILGIIIGNTELALEDIPEWNPAHFSLEEIKAASLRGKDIVRQLLSYIRKADYKTKPLRLIPVVKDSVKFLRATIPTSIDIRQTITADNDTILGDATQINQIMINLGTNAAHAMEMSGGLLEIKIQNVVLDEKSASFDPELAPGHYLKVTVSDTGHGMAPAIIKRIYDPYFTTKTVEKGSGMGLSVVLGVMKGYRGAISVESEPGKGARFDLYFPVAEEKIIAEPQAAEELPGGSEKILFIDDEASIVNMARLLLERLGYQVDARTSPLEALTLFRSKADQFDLVITDMTMPQMTGTKLVREILTIRPNMPIILCTGFSEKISEEDTEKLGIKAFALKPLSKRDLAVIVRQALTDGER